MMKRILYVLLFLVLSISFSGCDRTETEAARSVIEARFGPLENVDFRVLPDKDGDRDYYEITAEDGNLKIVASSPTALCYGFYHYMRTVCHSMVTWSGSNISIPEKWPDYHERTVSPYRLRYFLNVCTFGYTAPYWDWERWSDEIDWMALHGVNMPLASVASEAIAKRVWLRMGLTSEEIDRFFTGPAHLPWHRMGNLNSFDGPLDDEWHSSQIELQHRILDKMRALKMEPVAPAFAGFVPPAFLEKNPSVRASRLSWGGFGPEYNAYVLSPDSPYFEKIGKMFVEEWEKEFGKARYWLSDSFNEMELPVDEDDVEGKHALLKEYGNAIYSSIAAGDPDAVWVTQGWTFGYHHEIWDPESLQALLSEVPDDKMIIIDLANEYPEWIWHVEQTWKVHKGFYGKQWIYSYVPNFGGKVIPSGALDKYAQGSAEALASPVKGNLVGFGSAPEGLENNEIIFELLADMGWKNDAVDIEAWLEEYCLSRYGSCSKEMLEAWEKFHESVYGSIYSYPRFLWQTVVPDKRRASSHCIDDRFGEAVYLFASCSTSCASSELYRNDLVEYVSLWIGELADRHYEKALQYMEEGKKDDAYKELEVTVSMLGDVDRLLASHPDYRLSKWIGYARNSSESSGMKDKFESNAKRLITTWGGWQEDYAARFWSGLVSDYYIPRLGVYFSEGQEKLDEWEEEWIDSNYTTVEVPFDNPVEMAGILLEKYR